MEIENEANQGSNMEKHPSFRLAIEKPKSISGFMEKQKSFRAAVERQLSFIGAREKKRNNRDSPGKRGDSQLHLAARVGNSNRIREIVRNWNNNELKNLFSTLNRDGETPLYAAAENGHADTVAEMLAHMDLADASIIATNGYDAFHVAAKHGHLEVVRALLRVFPNLAMTTDSSCTTALHTAATQGHIDIVNLLLETDSELLKIVRNNGKTVLHSAARMGRLEVVRSILNKDPATLFRTDKKGQTALHMAVKGQNEEIVLELIKPDSSILSFEDNKGNTALHIAASKGRTQNAKCLLSAVDNSDSIINKGNKVGETALDIAEKLENGELIAALKQAGASNSKDNAKPPCAAKQLKQTVSEIKHDVESQLQQSRQTGFRVQKIAKRLKKLHISGLNNAINNATIVAVLIATVAFAAIFTIPGQYVQDEGGDNGGSSLGQAHIANNPAFIVFFVFDSLALFISLAVVVVQTSVVVIEETAKQQLVFVINKLMWLACLFISVSFLSLTYVVVGNKAKWLAAFATVIGSSIMLATIGSMCYCIISHRIDESKLRNVRRAESRSRSYSMSVDSDAGILNSEYKPMYAL